MAAQKEQFSLSELLQREGICIQEERQQEVHIYIYIYIYEVIVKYIERKKESVKRKKGVRKRAVVGIERSEVK